MEKIKVMETTIENRWKKNGKVCHVFWRYNYHQLPKVSIKGYNPFPFYGWNEIFTDRQIFDKWMVENGWTQLTTSSIYYQNKTETEIIL